MRTVLVAALALAAGPALADTTTPAARELEAAPVPRVTSAADAGAEINASVEEPGEAAGVSEPDDPADLVPRVTAGPPMRATGRVDDQAGAPVPRLPQPAGSEAVTVPAPPSEAYPPPPASKKAAYLAAKKLAPKPRPAPITARVGRPPPPVVSLYNTWTHEWIALDADGRAPDPLLVDRFLRCHFTNQPADMDRRLIGTLVEAARHFAVRRVDIVSGFRHPKYNLMLRKKGHEVARESQHTFGHAVDFRLPGVAIRALHNWARARGMGGVGLYLGSGFVHMDTGPIRYWGGQ